MRAIHAEHAESADGTRIHFEVSGTGAPVLLVHGFASHGRLNWVDAGWTTALAAAGRTAVTVDLRGHGGSDKPHDPARYAPHLLAEDLLAVLRAAGLDGAPVDVVTYSMGGLVGWALARRHPSAVGRLVLAGIGPAPAFDGVDPDIFVHSGRVSDEPRAAALLAMAAAVPGNDPVALRACARGVAGTALAGPTGHPTMFVAGDRDDLAAGAADLAAGWGAEFAPVPRRNHLNAVSARTFKDAAVAFLS